MGKNLIIFGAGKGSSLHIDNKSKDVLVLDEGPTRIRWYSMTAEAIYPIDFTQPNKRFILSLHYNGSNSFLFVNATKVYQFKARDSEIKSCTLCLDNISKDFTINNMKKTGLRDIVKLFSVDLNPIDTKNILNIHKYFMKKA